MGLDDYRKIKYENTQLRDQNAVLQEENQQLKEDNRKLRFKIADEQDEVNSLNGKIYQLKKEIEGVKND